MSTQVHATDGRIVGPERTSAELLDVGAVADLLNCSPRHVHRLSSTGRMPPAVRLGQLVRWRRTALRAWLDEGCPPVGASR